MEMALVLFTKLLSLFIIMALGFAMVRTGLLKAEESRSISMLSLYIVCPVAIMNAFRVDCTPEILARMGLAALVTVIAHIVFIFGTLLLKKPLKLSDVDRASIIYPNAGILTIPLVTAMLGSEWVVYSCAYNAIQILMLWTHGRILISGDRNIEIKKILLNSNMIAIFIGVVIFFTGLRFPSPIQGAIDNISAMIGPVGMLVTGMLLGGMPLKQVLTRGRPWLISMLRLILFPVIMVFILKISGLTQLVPGAETVLMISLLAIAGPSGATVMQMALIYRGQEAGEYASSINAISMLCCAVTMPLIIALYYL